jgi:peroxiredoxin
MPASCSYCQNTLRANARFCARCGQPIPATQVAPLANSLTCSTSGYVNRPGAKFCARCRAALNVPRLGSPAARRAALLGASGGVLIIILLGLMIVSLFSRIDQPRHTGDLPPAAGLTPIAAETLTLIRPTVMPLPASVKATAALMRPSSTPGTTARVSWQVGDQSPDFVLADLDGHTVRLSDLRGQIVVLNFWATWCGFCAAEMADLQAFYAEYQGRGIRVLALNDREDRETAQNYRDEHRLAFAILLDADGATGRAYHVTGLPVTVFIDRAGLIRAVLVGQQQEQDFSDQADALL